MSASSESEDLELNEDQSSAEEDAASVKEEEGEDDKSSVEGDSDNAGEDSGKGEPDINASATESDEEDEVDDDDDSPPKKKNVKPITSNAVDKITNSVMERHEKRKEKQLYIRFPEKLPQSMEEFQKIVKDLSELIVEAHKPRQNHARFCLADFASTEDRDKALIGIKKKNPTIFVSLPKTDTDEFIKTIIQKKIKKAEKKRAKNLLRKQSRQNVVENRYTSILSVLNLPKGTSTAQIKELFPDAVDIQTKSTTGKLVGKMMAVVTLPSTKDAKNDVKRKLELGGNNLIIKFNFDSKTKKPAAEKKGPIAPPNPKTKIPKSPKKRSISENGSTESKELPNKKTKLVKNGKAKKGKGVLAPAE